MYKKEYIPRCPVWELTLKCNLKCKHCGSLAGEERTNELTTERCLSICKELAEIGTKGVALMGGEVFLRKDWYVISKEIKDLGMKLSIVTNGFVNPKDIIPKLVRLEVDSLSIGLDGTEKTHNLIRGVNTAFEKTINFINECNKANLDPCPITTIHALNLKEFHEIEDLVLGRGLEWQVQSAFLIGRFPEKFLLSKGEHYALGLLIASAQKKYSKNRVFAGHALGFHSRFIPRLPLHPEWNGCYAGKMTLGIRSNGDINGCLPLPDKFTEDNIKEKSLAGMWRSPNFFKFNRQFEEKDLGGYCRNCKYRKTCKGGCSTRSISLTGHTHDDPYCFYRIEQEIFGENVDKKIEELIKKYSIAL